jgi:hypothetical protein
MTSLSRTQYPTRAILRCFPKIKFGVVVECLSSSINAVQAALSQRSICTRSAFEHVS